MDISTGVLATMSLVFGESGKFTIFLVTQHVHVYTWISRVLHFFTRQIIFYKRI
jgi:hypothetical protein